MIRLEYVLAIFGGLSLLLLFIYIYSFSRGFREELRILVLLGLLSSTGIFILGPNYRELKREPLPDLGGFKLVRGDHIRGDSREKKALLAYYRGRNDSRMEARTQLFLDKYGANLSLRGEGGELLDLEEILGKGPVLVEFMATWCPGCQDLVPSLRDLSEAGIRIISISLGDEDMDQLLDFKEENQSNWDYFILEDRQEGAYYGLNYIPSLFYLDREGLIKGVFSSSLISQDFLELMEP